MFEIDTLLLYLLIIVPAVLAWIAQARVRRYYEMYHAILNWRGASGLEVARYLLQRLGLTRVRIELTRGYISDHYDPIGKVLRLSIGVALGRSVTSLGVVAHEIGHAIQDAEGFPLLRVRQTLAVVLGQTASWSPLIFLGGILLDSPTLMGLGVAMLAGLALFSLVTLPVERDASRRAIAMLDKTSLTVAGESAAVRQVLRAAALTYVTGLGQRLALFLFYLVLVLAIREAQLM